MEEDKKDKGFVVKDRRRFSDTGDGREGNAAEGKEKEVPDIQPEVKTAEITFPSFIFSLGTAVMYHFGDFPDPVTKKSERNLAAAKQTIDIIGMLKEKTEGNLDPDEKNLIEGLLFELRMRYIKEADKG